MAMKSSDFNQVRVVLVEGNAALRSDLRAALIAKGMRDIISCRSLKSFLDVAKQECLDLVLCDSESLGAEFTDALQRIRRNDVGGNPFVVVVATVYDANVNRVHAVLNGGVDDLLVKPVRVNKVVDRIDHLVKERKPFVVTDNYIGPTRRIVAGMRAQRDDESYLRVPNTLRSKVVDKMNQERVRELIDQTVVDLNAKVMQHPIGRIEQLIQRILVRGLGDVGGDAVFRDFEELAKVSHELYRRYAGSSYAHIADLALALVNLSKRVAEQSAGGLTQVELNLLGNLGEAIRRAVAAESRSVGVTQEIAATVQRFADSPHSRPDAAFQTKH